MLTDIQFFSEILTRVQRHAPRPRHLFMHAEKERALQNSRYHPQEMFEVDYRGRTLGVQIFCDPSVRLGNLYVQVLAAPGAPSTNTQHVTLTQRNIESGHYYVCPSLVRCRNHSLQVQPRKIGSFPQHQTGSRNTFIVGPMHDDLLARVFEVAIAKYDSMAK